MFVLKLALVIAFVGGISSRSLKDEPKKYEGRKDYIVVFKDGFDVVKSSDDIFKRFLHFKSPPKVKYVYSNVIHGLALTEVSQDALDWLEKQEFVAYVEESLKMTSQDCTVTSSSPVTKSNKVNWGLDRITEHTYTQNDISYQPTGLGNGSVIYVMDSGIRTSHNEFSSSLFSNLYTYTLDDNYDDCTGHGTQVAGIAAGLTLGAANETTVKNVKISGCGGNASVDDVLDGLDQIYGDVTTNSYQDKCVVSLSYSLATDMNSLHTAIQNITGSVAKCVFVAAAGNYATTAYYWPAAYSETISVGAINAKQQSSKLACFSNYGTSVDIYAPGANLWTAHRTGNNKVIKVKGTSFAAPMVSAVVAILLQRSAVNATNVKTTLTGLATTDPAITFTSSGSNSNSRILYIN